MGMSEWAKREVEIACKKERGDKPETEWDYGCACYVCFHCWRSCYRPSVYYRNSISR